MHCKHCDIELTRDDKSYGKVDECRNCATDVDRYVGHMIWDHKTAPVIEIHASKSSLVALKDGRYNEGLKLVHEVKERSRRREGDDGTSSICLVPYRHASKSKKAKPAREYIEPIAVRHGSGKTFTSFSASQIKNAKKDLELRNTLTPEKYDILLRCARLPYSLRSGKRVEVWRDENGFYVKPPKPVTDYRTGLDSQTLHSLGYRRANYRR